MAVVLKADTLDYDGTDDATEKVIMAGLEKKGFTVRTADQDKTYLTANSQRLIDETFQKRNQQMEDTIRQVSGIEKLNGAEKYYDYFTRVMTKMKEDVTTATAKITELEKASGGPGANAGLVDELKSQIKTLQGRITTMTDEHTKAMNETKGEVFKAKFGALKDTAIAKIKTMFKGDLAAEVIPDIVAARSAEFDKNYIPKDVDGITIFHKPDGSPILSQKDGKPMNIEDLLTEVFKPYLDPNRQQGGAGSGAGKPGSGAGGSGGAGGGGAGGGAAKDFKTFNRPESVKTKVAVSKWLSGDMKIEAGTKQFDEAYAHFIVGTDGKELPMK